ncbi:MAG: hypothetical protein FWG18_03405 [Alphaproteobacteria bacterium]|nr:hypothetical protein [Alphaproteobacteria bacterium]
MSDYYYNMIIRPGELNDADAAAYTHSMSAMRAYRGILSDGLLSDHFGRKVLTEFWNKQIQNSVANPESFKVMVAQDANNGAIAGVCLASIATEKNDRRILPVLQKVGIQNFQDNAIGNINTLYLHPEYQGMGLGINFAHRIANSLHADTFITETLNGYDVSPAFFRKLGARNIGNYHITISEHYRTKTQNGNDAIILHVHKMSKADILAKCEEKFSRGTVRIKGN